ncbi:MAG: fused MFS/spermidine synthase [Myxococcales bacterium]|nr:fused MFS/spermidine synthase [Myxococcales bacterium]
MGTLAGYGRSDDQIVFYETDPEVISVARDSGHFDYLAESLAKIELVLGDARLSLEQELKDSGSRQFDVLVMDAFSSDAIPVHLLTREAFGVYLKHLRNDGLLAVAREQSTPSLVATRLAPGRVCRPALAAGPESEHRQLFVQTIAVGTAGPRRERDRPTGTDDPRADALRRRERTGGGRHPPRAGRPRSSASLDRRLQQHPERAEVRSIGRIRRLLDRRGITSFTCSLTESSTISS